MKLEVGKTYVIKITDHKTCDVLYEYAKIEKVARNIYPRMVSVLRLMTFAVSIVIPPLLLITLPLMKKYPQTFTKPTQFGVKQ